MKESGLKKVALYSRLSNDDELQGESNSISNQKLILEEYARKNGFTPFEHYADDGFTGATLDRPAFNCLMSEAREGLIGTVIVKDHSRLGRDRIEVGLLLERTFVELGIRYIAVNNGIDTANGVPKELAIMDLFNEWFLRDTSEKIRAGITASAKQGKSKYGRPPYGYRMDAVTKRLVPDENTADTVRLIFELYTSGKSIHGISLEMKERKILSPTAYLNTVTGYPLTPQITEEPYYWRASTIRFILGNEVYRGMTVRHKTTTPSYKVKKLITVPEEDRFRFEKTHEPIIDEVTWQKACERRATKQRTHQKDLSYLLCGKVFCADCGYRMYPDKNSFVCGRYKHHYYRDNGHCTPHRIPREHLEELVLSMINEVIEAEHLDREHFTAVIKKALSANSEKDIKRLEKEIAKHNARITTLSRNLQKAFEANIDGRLTDEQFRTLAGTYSAEKTELTAKIQNAQAALCKLKEAAGNVERFSKLADSYGKISELTNDVVNAFIEKVVVHERSVQGRKNNYTQEVDVYFKFVGKVL